MYASGHIINYSFIEPSTHRDHHMNEKTNYGLDLYDIIFGSKFNWNDIENYNHVAINTIIFTSLIIYFMG